MSYDNWKQTEPYNPDNDAPEAEDRFRCPHCDGWMVDGDPANVRLPDGTLICENCARTHPVITSERDRAFRSDVVRDDDRSRRWTTPINDPNTPQDQADDLCLLMVFERQAELTALYARIAELLYQARATYIGGGLPWGLLSAGQRQGYINEVRELVREVR